MSTEMKNGFGRRRCDVCRKLIPINKRTFFVKDTHAKKIVDCCSNKCRDNYFEDNYQLSLWGNPYSNTGILFSKGGES